jgi:hypothetical protein
LKVRRSGHRQMERTRSTYDAAIETTVCAHNVNEDKQLVHGQFVRTRMQD